MLKKICDVLSGLVLVILALVALALFLPKILGFSQFAVLSGSMEPNIHVGAVIYGKEADVSELQTGDIITYQVGNGTIVTHRIVSIDEESQSVITKGDANETEDASPVAFSNIVAKYAFDIPYLGYISIYAKTPLGIAVICGVLIVMVLLRFLPEIFSGEEEKVSEKKTEEKNSKK